MSNHTLPLFTAESNGLQGSLSLHDQKTTKSEKHPQRMSKLLKALLASLRNRKDKNK